MSGVVGYPGASYRIIGSGGRGAQSGKDQNINATFWMMLLNSDSARSPRISTQAFSTVQCCGEDKVHGINISNERELTPDVQEIKLIFIHFVICFFKNRYIIDITKFSTDSSTRYKGLSPKTCNKLMKNRPTRKKIWNI